MESCDAGRSDDAGLSGVAMTDGEASGRDGRRPGWAGLFWATVVVLVVGGFALSRSYGVQEVSSGTLPPVPPVPSTSTTTAPLVADTTPLESVDAANDDWMYQVTDVAVAPDGSVYVAAPVGVARLDGAGEWTQIDVEGLPKGTGLKDGLAGRKIEKIAIGPDGVLWVTGTAWSRVTDEQFGGMVESTRELGRVLVWLARYDCLMSCSWNVFTSNEVPALTFGGGDLVVSADGILYASEWGGDLLAFDGSEWVSHRLPAGWAQGFPWAYSMTVGADGVVWAASYGGLVAFDPVSGYTRYTTEDGLPSDNAFQVAAGADGTIWVATDALYADPLTASPDEAAGVAAFDGRNWTTYTMADGLLSNDAVIAAGADGTVWAVHYEIPPYGYARFDGSGWTSYRFDGPVGGFRAEVAPDGTLWTVSEDGLISFDGIARIIHPTPFVQPVPGAITISINRWEGVEGYRLLAVAWSGSEVVGGAFWTIIDSDPYTGTDMVHPPFRGDHPPNVEYESWGESDYLWDETAWLKPGTYQVTFWANPGELAPYGNLIPASPIERECSLVVEVSAGHNTTVTISEIPNAGDGGECQRDTDDTSTELFTFTPVQWRINLDDPDWWPGVHTVFMIVDVRPLTAQEVEDVSGRLIWYETVVDLCQIGFDRGDGFLQIGDIFQTTEGCGSNPTAMQDAFDEFGLPETACVTVTVDGDDHEYCAPLQVP